MWKIFSSAWKKPRFWDALFAYCQDGLRGLRFSLSGIATFRREEKRKPALETHPSVEPLESRLLPSAQITPLPRYDDPRMPALVQVGEASVDVNLGAVRVGQALDFDKSPGTSMGGDPVLVYNGATVNVRPIIQVNITPDAGMGTLTQIRLRLQWDNGSFQSWVTYTPGGGSDPLVVGVQQDSPVTETGRYRYDIEVELTYTGGTTTDTVTGYLPVVVQDSGVTGKKDYFGAGWGISGVDRLVSVTDGLLWVHGTGENRFFDEDGGNYVSPAGEFGTLVPTTEGYAYTANGDVKKYFDPSGLLTKVVDLENFTRAYSYDGDGRLTQIVSADGGTATLGYDGNGFLQTITEPGSRTVSATQAVASGVGSLTQLVDAAGFTRGIGYDGEYKLTTDSWAPYATTMTYDSVLDTVSQVNLGGGSTYDIVAAATQPVRMTQSITSEASSQATITDGLTRTTTYDLDQAGRMLVVEQPSGRTESLGYDGNGLLTTARDPDGDATSYGYDSYGQLTSVDWPDGSFVTYSRDGTFYDRVTKTVESAESGDPITTTGAYDSLGQLTSFVDGEGLETDYTWSNGRMDSATDAFLVPESYYYDANLRWTATVDEEGNGTTSTYSSAGDISTFTDGDGNVTNYGYDGNNQLTAENSPLLSASYSYLAAGFQASSTVGGITTTQDYDSRGWATRVVDGAGATTQYAYDAAGDLTLMTDGRTNTWQQSYDQDGRATRSVDPEGGTALSEYDANNDVTRRIDAEGGTTLYAYDKGHRGTQTQDPEGRVSQTKYDLAGRVTETVDGAGNHTFQDYDKNHNVTLRIDGNGHTTLYEFEKGARLTEMTDANGNTTLYAYDRSARLTKTTDANGNAATQVYDQASNVTTSINGLGYSTQYAYDSNNRLTLTTDAEGRWTKQYHDNVGRVTKTETSAGASTLQSFDGDGRVTSSTDGAGGVTAQSYDKNGNVTEVGDAGGGTTLMSYDGNNRLTKSVDPDTRTTLQAYDKAGRVTTVTDNATHTTQYVLDKSGLATQIIDATGYTTLQEYDGNGRLTEVSDAEGFTSLTSYDVVGHVTSTTDKAGYSSYQNYDPADRLTHTVDGASANRYSYFDNAGLVTASVNGNGFTTQYEYDAANQLTKTIYPNTFSMTQAYDQAGLATLTTDPNGHTMRQEYDAGSRVTKVYDGNNNASQSAYDGNNRVTLTTDRDGRTQQIKYDAMGRVTETIDGANRSTVQEYDLAGRTTATIDMSGKTTLMEYDAAGNKTAVIDPNGGATVYGYDLANRLVSITDASTNVTTYDLNRVGNATLVTDPNLETAVQAFDGEQRLTQRITPNGDTLSYSYDGVGRQLTSPDGTFAFDGEGNLISASNANGAYGLSYDNAGRLTRVTEPYGVTLDFAYDKVGNRTQVIDSKGGTEASTYDAENYLTTRTYEGQGQEMRVEFTNNKEGWNTTLTRYSDLAGTTLVATTETGYDGAGRVTHIVSKDASYTILNQLDYSYTSGGNLASKTETQNGSTTSLTYGYDDASQMTAEGTATYAYDATGNRTGGGNVVNTGNRLASDGLWDYTYDDNGNVVKKSQGPADETWIYGYSPNNRLILVQKWTEDPTFPGTAVLQLEIEYKYDAFGNRIEKAVDDDGLSGDPAVTIGFAYDGWNPSKLPSPSGRGVGGEGIVGRENFDVLMHVDDAGSLTTRYEYTDRVDQQLGRIDVGVTTDTYWTLGDYQNSVRDVIDNAGVVKDAIRYDGYGNIVAETDSTYRGWYGWTGREVEIETDLQYNHARWYDPQTGRWMSQDQLEFDAGDSNLYRYVMNRPTNATDPSGLQPPFGPDAHDPKGLRKTWGMLPGQLSERCVGPDAHDPKGLQKTWGIHPDQLRERYARQSDDALKLEIIGLRGQRANIEEGILYAQMSAAVYKVKTDTRWQEMRTLLSAQKWDVVDEDGFQEIQDPATGFGAVAFKNAKTGEVVLAFRGTDGVTWNDWITNIAQGMGYVTKQYDQANAIGAQFKSKYGHNLKYTGHSLGGGLAGAAAINNKVDTITQNAAGIHAFSADRTKANKYIQAYRVVGEPLTSLQDGELNEAALKMIPPFLLSKNPLSILMPNSNGRLRRVPGLGINTLGRHSIYEVIRGLESELPGLDAEFRMLQREMQRRGIEEHYWRKCNFSITLGLASELTTAI